ncbi:Mads box transcription factor, partial [Globisporangium splendens]
MATPLFPTPTAADDNVIRYALLFAHEHADTQSPVPSVDPAAALNSADKDLQFVQQQCAELLAFAHERTREFIWQRHQFHLQPTATASVDLEDHFPDDAGKSDLLMAYYLAGETSVGDEIQDEWVVMWLLWEITKRNPNVLVRVQDSDGEFLLIECADVLPEWVHPENSDGRVLMKDGALHLVPPTVVKEPPQSHSRRRRKSKAGTNGSNLTPLLRDCIHAVLRDPARTEASGAVQRTLGAKLSQVPSFMKENRHRIRCVLPRKATCVLKRVPGILGAAVEAFYYREPKQATSICNRMDVFLPAASDTEAQSSSLCMVTFSRCMFAQLKQQQFFAPKPFQRHPGYSALAGGSRDHDDAKSRDDDAAVARLATDIGMKLTCGLEILYATSAKDQFGAVWRHTIDEALKTSDGDVQELPDALGANDDDSWLYVHPDSLEEKLKQVEESMGMAKSGATGNGDDFGDTGGAEELENIATMFNNFLGGISGIDGIEGNEPIQFDMSAFMEILNGDGSGPQREPRFSEGGDYFYEDDDDDDDSLIHSSDEDSDDEEVDARMEAAMAEMDAELATSKMSKSFASSRFEEINDETLPDLLDEDDVEVDVAADKPLDLDFNLLSNLLESFASQEGHAGPVSNILNEMNFPRGR